MIANLISHADGTVPEDWRLATISAPTPASHVADPSRPQAGHGWMIAVLHDLLQVAEGAGLSGTREALSLAQSAAMIEIGARS